MNRGTTMLRSDSVDGWSGTGGPTTTATSDVRFSTLATLDPAAAADTMAELLLEEVPDLGGHAELEAPAALRSCCEANIEEVLRLLRSGSRGEDFLVPGDAQRFTVLMVRRRVPKAALLRGYRIGHRLLWSMLIARLNDGSESDLALADTVATLLFSYIDAAIESHSEIYDREHREWVRSAPAMRMETATEILAGESVDLGVASLRLAYDLRARHVAFTLGAASSAVVLDDLHNEATATLEILGATSHLLLVVSEVELWGWAAVDSQDATCLERLERHIAAPGVRLAVGRARCGIDGFRTSHDEARCAADLHRPDDRAPVSYRDVELVALLAANDDRCRRFVQTVLGDLARDDEPTAALRETVLGFLDAGGSHLAAAERLYLHKNTVFGRVRRAESVLGRDIQPGDAGLHSALTVAHRLPELLRVAGDD